MTDRIGKYDPPMTRFEELLDLCERAARRRADPPKFADVGELARRLELGGYDDDHWVELESFALAGCELDEEDRAALRRFRKLLDLCFLSGAIEDPPPPELERIRLARWLESAGYRAEELEGSSWSRLAGLANRRLDLLSTPPERPGGPANPGDRSPSSGTASPDQARETSTDGPGRYEQIVPPAQAIDELRTRLGFRRPAGPRRLTANATGRLLQLAHSLAAAVEEPPLAGRPPANPAGRFGCSPGVVLEDGPAAPDSIRESSGGDAGPAAAVEEPPLVDRPPVATRRREAIRETLARYLPSFAKWSERYLEDLAGRLESAMLASEQVRLEAGGEFELSGEYDPEAGRTIVQVRLSDGQLRGLADQFEKYLDDGDRVLGAAVRSFGQVVRNDPSAATSPEQRKKARERRVEVAIEAIVAATAGRSPADPVWIPGNIAGRVVDALAELDR